MRRFWPAIFAALLAACGDSVTFKTSDEVALSECLYELSYSGEAVEGLTAADSIFAYAGDTVYLAAGTYAGGELLESAELYEYFFTRYWDVRGSFKTDEEVAIIAADTSSETFCHYSVDNLGDTVFACAEVFRNTPLTLELRTPADGENGLAPGDTLEFSWSHSGVDEFETELCEFLVSNELATFWNATPDTVPCGETLKIPAKKFADSSAYYWAVRLSSAVRNFTESAVSELRHFRVKPDSGAGAMFIPVRYGHARSQAKLANLTILQNDTALLETEISGDTLLEFRGLTQDSLYEIRVEETLLLDYAPETLQVAATYGRFTEVDTITLVDETAPEAMPLKESFPAGDSVRFYIAENGSGLNALRSAVILYSSSDTLDYRFSNSKMAFSLECSSDCYVWLSLEDNEGNASPRKLWRLSFTSDSIFVLGPYAPGSL